MAERENHTLHLLREIREEDPEGQDIERRLDALEQDR